MNGPMNFIYSVNYFIGILSQMYHMVGMNAHVAVHLFQSTSMLLLKLENVVRTSEFRRWIQRKSKKSAVLRYLFVLSSMAIVGQVVRLVRFLVAQYFSKKKNLLQSAVSI